MAIAFDALSQSAEVSGVNSVSWTHTTSGSDRGLFIGAGNADALALSSATYAGTGLTVKWNIADASNIQNSGATMPDPATGANTAVATWAGTVTSARAQATSLTGVDQTTPVGTAATATGNSATATVNVSSAANELVIDFMEFVGFGSTITVGASQTERMNVPAWFGTLADTGVSTEPGAATVTMSWTSGANTWSIGAIPFKPVAAGGDANRVRFPPQFSGMGVGGMLGGNRVH